MPEATKGNCLCVLVPEAQAVHQEDGPQKRNPNTCHRRRYELSRVIRPGRFRMCANEWGCKTVIVQDVWPVLGFSVDTHGIGKPFFSEEEDSWWCKQSVSLCSRRPVLTRYGKWPGARPAFFLYGHLCMKVTYKHTATRNRKC